MTSTALEISSPNLSQNRYRYYPNLLKTQVQNACVDFFSIYLTKNDLGVEPKLVQDLKWVGPQQKYWPCSCPWSCDLCLICLFCSRETLDNASILPSLQYATRPRLGSLKACSINALWKKNLYNLIRKYLKINNKIQNTQKIAK